MKSVDAAEPLFDSLQFHYYHFFHLLFPLQHLISETTWHLAWPFCIGEGLIVQGQTTWLVLVKSAEQHYIQEELCKLFVLNCKRAVSFNHVEVNSITCTESVKGLLWAWRSLFLFYFLSLNLVILTFFLYFSGSFQWAFFESPFLIVFLWGYLKKDSAHLIVGFWWPCNTRIRESQFQR